MAAMGLFKRLLSWPKQCRSLCQAGHSGVSCGSMPVLKMRWMLPLQQWTKKNVWEDTPTEKNPALTILDESEEDSKNTYIVVHWKDSDTPPGCSCFIHIIRKGHCPVRTSAFNDFLRPFVRPDYSYGRIARPFLAQMLLTGTKPDLATFSVLVRCYCKHLTYQHVLDVVYTQMKALGVEANDSFLKILMNGVCARFGPNVGYQLLKKLRSSHRSQMPLACYAAVLGTFCKRKKMVLELIDLLMEMKQLRIFPDDQIYDCLLKGQRNHGCQEFLKAVGIGSQLFGEGMKTGAVSSMVVRKYVMLKSVNYANK